MTFAEAVAATPEIAGAYQRGLQALKGEHRNRIEADDTRSLAGSVDLDRTLKTAYPQASRWDYAVGYPVAGHDDQVAYVEVHPANTSKVDDVIAKKNWLTNWLHGKPLDGLPKRGFYWVPSGGDHILRGSRQFRQLGQAGITLCSSVRLGA